MDTPRFFKSLSILCLPFTLIAQEYWAVEVIAYTPGSGAAAGYDIQASALGRPTYETYADFTSIDPTVVVVPVYTAWDFTELISIGEGGSLVLRMGQAVTNDPSHPYGTDLLVFSNTFITGSDLYDQNTQNPNTYTLANSANIGIFTSSKLGKVSLSEDGITWYDFPTAYDLPRLLPTLGRMWTGSGWGQLTDPTIPPDPDLTLADLAGMNLAELCRRYRGGAGGIGFDLENLIPPQTGTLPTSFEYVRISVPDDGDGNTNYRIEIDAVTIVSPATAYTRWTQDHFNWVEDPAIETASANPEGDAFDNWQEFARGGDPKVEELSLWLPDIMLSADTLSYTLPMSVEEAPWLLQSATNLVENTDWQDVSPQPIPIDILVDENIEREMTVPVPNPSGAQFFKLRLQDPQ